LQRAVAEFSGTNEEVRIIVAQSDLSLKMGDLKKALNMLKKITPDNPNFITAKKKMADIYLTQLMDRKNYTKCYMEVLDSEGSMQNYKMVANALMNIQEPEEAIKFYEKALLINNDTAIVREIGQALVMTHDYNRAIRYYENALREDPKLLDLRTDLAELYIKLKAFEDAKRVLIDALKSLKHFDVNDVEVKSKNVGYLLMMARVFLEEDMQMGDWKFKPNQDAKQALIEARSLQQEVIEKCRELSSDKIDTERALLAEINFKLGKYLDERENNPDASSQALNDCLTRKDDHQEAILSLAKLAQARGDNDQCVQYCQRLLKIDPSHEEASFMIANLKFIKNEAEGAIQTFTSLLDSQPDNYRALS
jgi:tetratricopeptide repeat protein 21B